MPNSGSREAHSARRVETSADTGDGAGIAILLIWLALLHCGGCLSFVLSRRRTAGTGDKSGKPAAGDKSEAGVCPRPTALPAGHGMTVELFKKQTVDGNTEGRVLRQVGKPAKTNPGASTCTCSTTAPTARKAKMPPTLYEFDNLCPGSRGAGLRDKTLSAHHPACWSGRLDRGTSNRLPRVYCLPADRTPMSTTAFSAIGQRLNAA